MEGEEGTYGGRDRVSGARHTMKKTWVTAKKNNFMSRLGDVEIVSTWQDDTLKELVITAPSGEALRVVAEWNQMGWSIPAPPTMVDRFVVTVSGGPLAAPVRSEFAHEHEADEMIGAIAYPLTAIKTVEQVRLD